MLDCGGIVLDCAGILLNSTILLYRGKIVVSCVPVCERIMPEACEQCEMILVDCRRNVIDGAIVPAYYILNLW